MLTRPPDPREDSELLAAVTEGDREALAELYRRHLPWLLVRLGRRCSSPELVLDPEQRLRFRETYLFGLCACAIVHRSQWPRLAVVGVPILAATLVLGWLQLS